MADAIEFSAQFDDGKMIIERRDGKPIDVITHEELGANCVEILELNSTGHAVKAMQCLLNCHGAHLDEDGIFGSCTQTELMIYQDRKGLPVTGECTMLEWEILIHEN